MNRYLIFALVMAPTFPVLAQDTSPPAPPMEFSESSVAQGKSSDVAAAYARHFAIDNRKAREQLALQDRAAQYASDLRASDPEGYVDLEIEHTPNFKVSVYYAKSIDLP